AYVDPQSGEWVDGTDPDGPSATEGGSGGTTTTPTSDTTPSDTTPTDSGDTDTTGGDTTTTSGETQVVTAEVGGHEVGVAMTLDTDHEGKAERGVIYADGRAG